MSEKKKSCLGLKISHTSKKKEIIFLYKVILTKFTKMIYSFSKNRTQRVYYFIHSKFGFMIFTIQLFLCYVRCFLILKNRISVPVTFTPKTKETASDRVTDESEIGRDREKDMSVPVDVGRGQQEPLVHTRGW